MITAQILDTTASFELAAFFVSWVAVALLAVIAANLHHRVTRLERAVRLPSRTTPFGAMVGQSLRDHLPPPTPRLVLLVGSSCDSCRSLLHELAAAEWDLPTVVAWKSPDPAPPTLPESVRHWNGGAVIATKLGVASEPLALVLDDEATIVAARPTSSVSTLRALVHTSQPYAPLPVAPTEVTR